MVRLTAATAGHLALIRMAAVAKRLLRIPISSKHAIRMRAICIAAAPLKAPVTLPAAGRSSGEKRRAALVQRIASRDGMPMADRLRRQRPTAIVRNPRKGVDRNQRARGAAITNIVIAAAPRRARCRERMSSGPGATGSARPVMWDARPPDNRGRAAVRAPRAVPERFIRMRRASARKRVRLVARRRSKAAIPDISASNRAAIRAGLAVRRI